MSGIVIPSAIAGGFVMSGTGASINLELPEGADVLLLTNLSGQAPAWVAFGDDTVTTDQEGLPVLAGGQLSVPTGGAAYIALYAAGGVSLNVQYWAAN